MYFCRGTINLIGQDQIVEYGALLKYKGTFLGPIDLSTGDVRGQEIRRKLNAVKFGFDTFRQNLNCLGFGKAWRALDKQVPVREAFVSQTRGAWHAPKNHPRETLPAV